VKYSGNRPEIKVSLLCETHKGVISISDNGTGIPEKYRSKIFKQFVRVPHGNIHDVKGFGLGLHFVKKVIKAHGWKIKLTSNPGEGSKFDIYFKL
jgi:two-component system phosphate regulon sensor histidine kinase PhoR